MTYYHCNHMIPLAHAVAKQGQHYHDMTILLCQWQQLMIRIKQVIVVNIIKQTIQYIIITVISMTQLLMVTSPLLLASNDLIISAAVAVVRCVLYRNVNVWISFV